MKHEQKTHLLKPMIIMLIILGVIFGSIYLYKKISSAAMNAAMSGGPPPVTVSAMPIPYESWETKLTSTGTAMAINGVDVTSEITGLVKKIVVEPGVEVKAGDILVELNADAEIAQLHALEADAALAEINFKRDQEQYKIKGVSKATLDTSESTVKSKKALAAQQAAVVAKKTIRAPFSGRLGVIIINEGQFINPGDKMVTLQSLDPIYVDFNLPQQDLPRIGMNQPVTITTDAFPQVNFTGKITTINPKADPATRNVTVEATVKNPEKKLLPGMYGVVHITIGSPKNVLTLPQAAITYNPYGDAVYILKEKEKGKDGKPIYVAHQKFVTLGETRGDQVQILKGVEKGELIVTAGQLKLKNGSLAVVNNTIVPENKANPHPNSHYGQ